jgi:hypothetical protein
MWVTNEVVDSVNEVATIFYIDQGFARLWNAKRNEDELRMMTGWMWVDRKNPNHFHRSLKSKTAAYIDAWYALVIKKRAPKAETKFLEMRQRRKVA